MLSRFKTKLHSIKGDENSNSDNEDERNNAPPTTNEDINDEELNSDQWLKHKLRFDTQDNILAKDASTKNDDWHDIYDPRNAINKRKRGDERKHNSDHDRERERDRHRYRK